MRLLLYLILLILCHQQNVPHQFLPLQLRLEMGKFQLIDDIENNLRHTNKGNRGLCLPQDFISGNISILIQESGARNDHAVISIAGTMYGAPYHSIIRLQVSEGDGNNQLDRVLAHRVAAGAIPVVTSRTDYVFLASCSYHFDLKDANSEYFHFKCNYMFCTK